MKLGTGARKSPYDPRTIKHDRTLAAPLVKGGVVFDPKDIEDQRTVGICTAISLTMNAGRVYGKKFSADFQYLLQKKYYDKAWFEGSSIFYALKVGKNFGFLEAKDFPYITEADRDLPYSEYAAKLQAIPDSEITRLLSLCTHKLTGYAQVDVSDPQFIAKAINDSKAGIIVRYDVGNEWWTPSWKNSDLEPQGYMRPPAIVVSGHAVGSTYFDYSTLPLTTTPNSWSALWNDYGNGHFNWNTYKMTEAWIPYYDFTPTIPDTTLIMSIQLKLIDLLRSMIRLLGKEPVA